MSLDLIASTSQTTAQEMAGYMADRLDLVASDMQSHLEETSATDFEKSYDSLFDSGDKQMDRALRGLQRFCRIESIHIPHRIDLPNEVTLSQNGPASTPSSAWGQRIDYPRTVNSTFVGFAAIDVTMAAVSMSSVPLPAYTQFLEIPESGIINIIFGTVTYAAEVFEEGTPTGYVLYAQIHVAYVNRKTQEPVLPGTMVCNTVATVDLPNIAYMAASDMEYSGTGGNQQTIALINAIRHHALPPEQRKRRELLCAGSEKVFVQDCGSSVVDGESFTMGLSKLTGAPLPNMMAFTPAFRANAPVPDGGYTSGALQVGGVSTFDALETRHYTTGITIPKESHGEHKLLIPIPEEPNYEIQRKNLSCAYGRTTSKIRVRCCHREEYYIPCVSNVSLHIETRIGMADAQTLKTVAWPLVHHQYLPLLFAHSKIVGGDSSTSNLTMETIALKAPIHNVLARSAAAIPIVIPRVNTSTHKLSKGSHQQHVSSGTNGLLTPVSVIHYADKRCAPGGVLYRNAWARSGEPIITPNISVSVTHVPRGELPGTEIGLRASFINGGRDYHLDKVTIKGLTGRFVDIVTRNLAPFCGSTTIIKEEYKGLLYRMSNLIQTMKEQMGVLLTQETFDVRVLVGFHSLRKHGIGHGDLGILATPYVIDGHTNEIRTGPNMSRVINTTHTETLNVVDEFDGVRMFAGYSESVLHSNPRLEYPRLS